MKTPRFLLAAVLTLASLVSAQAFDRPLNNGRIKDNGDIQLSDDVKLGKRQDGKTILQPDSIQIGGAGSTGDLSTTTVLSPGSTTGRTQAERASDAINIKDWGAKGDNTVVNAISVQAAFDKARADNKAVRLPCGTYIWGAIINIYDVPIDGDATGCVIIRSSNNAPIFRMDATGFGVQDRRFGRFTCRFEVATGQDTSNTACIQISGDGTNYVQENRFHDILAQGAKAAIAVDKANANGPFGYEGRVGRNIFDNIQAVGYTNPAKYRIWFKTGSGTANVFTHMSGGVGNSDPASALIRIEGTDTQGHPVVVGDITVANSQFQDPKRIVSVGPGSVYNDNINFPGTQFDGIGDPISFEQPGVTPQGLRIVDANIGGSIDIYRGLGTGIRESIIQDRGTSRWTAGVTKNPTANPAYFKLELSGTFTVTTCSFTFYGLIGGYGGAYADVKYAFMRAGGTLPAEGFITQQSYRNSGGAILTDPSTAALKTSVATTNPASDGAPVTATVSVVFSNLNSANTIEGQAVCSGGTFRLQRITN